MARQHVLACLLAVLLSFIPAIYADRVIQYTDAQNNIILLDDDRRPALYTESFGDCLGSQKSLIDVNRWDAALYKDNMTIAFHIGGTTNLTRESVMIYIAVYAYGENRFELTWNPCGTGVIGLCPVRSDTAIEASGFIPLGVEDLQSIPNIALSIPDFEGQAILRIFANSTQTEIACFTAEVTNGATFEQPASVGTILGIFALVAVVSSIAAAIYGENVPEMRSHYAHSMSVLVVFAVYHHIYFTGALSMNFPSVLVSFWSNYAWSAGMIYTRSMQNSITKFMGKYSGDTLAVGAAAAGADSTNVGGGFDVHRIYKRIAAPLLMKRELAARNITTSLVKRASSDSLDTSKWHGELVRKGLPLPGNYSGFAGTLSKEDIPAANAFLTGLIWLAICILIVAGSLVIFKFMLDFLHKRTKWKTDQLDLFKSNWIRFVAMAVLRICYIAFFMMMFLTIFQFTYRGSPGALAIAAIVFVLFLCGMFSVVGYACYYRLRHGTWTSAPDRIQVSNSKHRRFFPSFAFHRASKVQEVQGVQEGQEVQEVQDTEKAIVGSIPAWSLKRTPNEGEVPAHEDEQFILRHGWLAARFRDSRWWFFAFWIVYEFVRACFYGGASGHALVQVYCLLIVEFAAFLVVIKLKPFEGQRLNIIMVYLLGFSKVTTVALSSAFDINFNIARIPATVIGIIIIIIQGCLTIALLVCIALGAISTYFSITRNREHIKPKSWMRKRAKYLGHVQQTAADLPKPKRESKVPEEPETPKEPYFSVTSVKRIAKIEDEDEEFQRDILVDPRNDFAMQSEDDMLKTAESSVIEGNRKMRRSNSIAASLRSNASRSSLPRGAVLHRGSWSSRDYRLSQADFLASGRSNPSTPVAGNFPLRPFEEVASPSSNKRGADESTPPVPNVNTSAILSDDEISPAERVPPPSFEPKTLQGTSSTTLLGGKENVLPSAEQHTKPTEEHKPE